MKPKPPLASVTANALRRAQGLSEEEVAARSGISERMVGHYMTGEREPKGEVMDKLVSAMGYDPGSDQPVRRALEQVCSPGEEPRSPVDPTAEERRGLGRTALLAGLGVADIAEESAVRFIRRRRAARARRRADRLWNVLKGCTPQRRRLLIEKAEEYQRWYVAERLAHESERAASHQPALALELAELGLRAAELSPGTDEFRAEVIGYVLLFVGNAQRVQGDLHESDAAFAQARKLLAAGAAADPGIFAAWRLPDREASLRRAQRRFEEALPLHDEALALGPEAAGRILLNKASTLEQSGDAEGAIAVLREAEPLVDGRLDPRLPCVLRFNRVAALCDLARFGEARVLLHE
ncbi:MAG TPA: helix-turn-helix domain-containing protein, partial [Thermoanaerobaculia bacterium]|nr:helix-turn-helix domain-containing protein [Thermoanaerobaculia bacterium]